MKALDVWTASKKGSAEERQDFIAYLSGRVDDLEAKADAQEEKIQKIVSDNIDCDRKWRDCESKHFILEQQLKMERMSAGKEVVNGS